MQKRVTQRKRRKRRRKSVLILLCVLIGIFLLYNGIQFSVKQISGQNQSGAQTDNGGIDSSDEEEWCLTLVNKWNPMKTDGSEIKTVELSNGERVDERIYPQLQEMFDDAREDGIHLIVASGYRTEREQEEIYNNKIAEGIAEGLSEEEAKEEAELWVAVPGTSEHQLGLSVDINADGVYSTGSEVYDWLANHAYKYGFINRYPSDKTEITGVANEPWHYRYVGVKAAGKIHAQGICLEEYLGKLQDSAGE